MNIVYCDKNSLGRWFRPIEAMQYNLRSISRVYPNIPTALVNGRFGPETTAIYRLADKLIMPPGS